MVSTLRLVALCLGSAALVQAHGSDHGSDHVESDPNDSWQVRHMKEEHGFDEFDSLSFFKLHDLDGSDVWSKSDILNLYGLLNQEFVGDGSGMGKHEESTEIKEETKKKVLDTVLLLIDTNKDNQVSLEEWKSFSDAGNELPDFGLGPGHHGDYEYEYEVHHWLKYHAKDDPDVKIVHKEDIEHEALYHAHEHEDNPNDHQEVKIIQFARFGNFFEKNVPLKFLKNKQA